MKKTVTFLMLLIVSISMSLQAQNYAQNFGDDANADNARRWAETVFTGANAPSETIDCRINNDDVLRPGPIYRGLKTTNFTAYQGKQFTATVNGWLHWVAIAMFVDFNGDGDFTDDGEHIGINKDPYDNAKTRAITADIPATAKVGKTRVRIIFGWLDAGYTTGTVGQNQYSSTEIGQKKNARVFDFEINISDAQPVTLSLAEGTYNVGKEVNISNGFKYTLDGSDPTAESADVPSDGNINLPSTVGTYTLKVTNSDNKVFSATYTTMDMSKEYFVVFGRYGDEKAVKRMTALEDQSTDGSEQKIKNMDLDAKDAQLWIISESATNAGYLTATSKNGNKMIFKGDRFYTTNSSTTEAVDFRILPSTSAVYAGYEVIQRFGTGTAINTFGGSTPGKEIGEWMIDDGGGALKIFAKEDGSFLKSTMLNGYITEAEELATVSVGDNAGQVSTEGANTYNGVINTAKTFKNSSTGTVNEVLTQIADLNSAKTDFMNSIALPKISDNGSEYWYFIQGSRGTSSNGSQYLTSNGSGANLSNQTKNSTDAQVWKLVKSGTGFALVNKATGEYLNTDKGNAVALNTQANAPARALKFRKSADVTNSLLRFWLENAEEELSFRFHSGNTNVLNYIKDETDNCTWLFETYDPNAAKRAILVNTLNKAIKMQERNVAVGEEFGETTQAHKDELGNAITAANPVNGNSAATEEALTNAIDGLNSAMSAVNSDMTNFSKLEFDGKYYKWFTIRNTYNKGTQDQTKHTISYVTEGDKFIGKVINNRSTEIKDEDLFTLTKNGENYQLKNGLSPQKYLGANGNASAVAVDFKITQIEQPLDQTEDPLDRYTIKAGSNPIIHLNIAGGQQENITTGGGSGWISGSLWYIEYVKSTTTKTPTSVENATADSFKVSVQNGLIRVNGVEEFEVYNIAGQKQDRKSQLTNGVYIVKIDNVALKVLVK